MPVYTHLYSHLLLREIYQNATTIIQVVPANLTMLSTVMQAGHRED